MNRPTLLLSLLALSTPALAQDRKPLPPPPPPPNIAPAGLERLASFNDWLAAYQRAGTPRMLFYSDLLTSSRGDTKLLNDSAAITRLGGRVEQWFRSPEVILLNPGAVSLTTEEQRRVLRENDEFSAASMIGRQSQADVVVFIRLIEQSGRKDGVAYTGTYVMADLRQGTSIDRHSWDMSVDPVTGEFDATRMAQYAQALANRITNTFILQFPPAVIAAPAPGVPAVAPSPVVVPDQGPGVAPGSTVAPGAVPTLTPGSPSTPAATAPIAQAPPLAPRRFTLRLAGEYEDQTVINFRNAITNLAWMQPGSLVERGLSTDNGVKSMVFEITYAGSVIDLQHELSAIAADRLEQDAAVLQARDGLIVLQLRPSRLSAAERQLIAPRDTVNGLLVRQQFRDAYTKANRPKLAVMVNALSVPNPGEPSFVPPAGPGPDAKPGEPLVPATIVVAPRIVVGNSNTESAAATDPLLAREEMFRRERELLLSRAVDTRTMEDNIYQRFIKLGVDMRDLSEAQLSLYKSGAAPGQVVPEGALITNLGSMSKADIVISGTGRVARTSPDGYPSRIIYTFRAYRLSDKAVLAADSVEDDVDYTKPEWSRAVERLADEAAAKMAAQLMEAWTVGR